MTELYYTRIYDEELNDYADARPETFPLRETLMENFPDYKFEVTYFDNRIRIYTDTDLTIEEQSQIDNIVQELKDNYPSTALDYIKRKKIEEIKANQNIIVYNGFEWPEGSGNYFRIDTTATTEWNGLYTATISNKMQFPVYIRTVDDKVIELKDANEVTYFYMSGLAFKKNMYTQTAQLIFQIENCKTISDVLVIEDPRV